jgi:hypothetical protein
MRAEGEEHMSEQKKSLHMRAVVKGHITEEMEVMRAEGTEHMSEQKKSLDLRAEGKGHITEEMERHRYEMNERTTCLSRRKAWT